MTENVNEGQMSERDSVIRVDSRTFEPKNKEDTSILRRRTWIDGRRSRNNERESTIAMKLCIANVICTVRTYTIIQRLIHARNNVSQTYKCCIQSMYFSVFHIFCQCVDKENMQFRSAHRTAVGVLFSKLYLAAPLYDLNCMK